MKDSITKEYCTANEIAHRMGVTVRTIHEWRVAGKLPNPAIKGKSHLYRLSEVDAAIKKMEEE